MMGYLFNKIYAQVENSPILMTDQNTNSDDKKKLVEIAFEQYETPAFFTCKKSVLSLFANGKTSGMVIETGCDSTQAVPISDGFVLHKNMYTLPIGGEYTTQKILESVEKINLKSEIAPLFDLKMVWENRERKDTLYQPLEGVSDSVRRYHRLQIARDIKESCCKIYTNKHEMYLLFLIQIRPTDTVDYELPDGQVIKLGEERFHIPESIYKPLTVKFFLTYLLER
jgi:actin-related protein